MSEPRPPVAIPTSTIEDTEHRRRERAAIARQRERLTALSFGVSVLAALGLGVVYWRGGQSQLEGVFLALAFGGLGVGFIVWAKHFMPHEEVTEERHPLESTDDELTKFREEFERGEHVLERRGLLVKAAAAAAAALGAALIFPIRSLGPRPGKGLKSTPFGAGVRLVTESNQPVKPTDLARDSVLTVFPENHTDAADASTVLIRPGKAMKARPGRETWTPDGVVAYSKLCTHVGCPVGLYQAEAHLLLCPCHQSTFDVLDGARPIFGPAARSLPQLPLGIDADGHLISLGDFSSPTGPGFWDRGR